MLLIFLGFLFKLLQLIEGLNLNGATFCLCILNHGTDVGNRSSICLSPSGDFGFERLNAKVKSVTHVSLLVVVAAHGLSAVEQSFEIQHIQTLVGCNHGTFKRTESKGNDFVFKLLQLIEGLNPLNLNCLVQR